MSSGSWVRMARSARLFGVVALGLALAGCIRPLYGPQTASTQNQSLRATLAAIDVPMVPDRLGHTLRNELVFLLDGREETEVKRYRLLISTNENVSVTIVSSFQRADAASVNGVAKYRLISIADNREIAAGEVTGFATYERSPQRFANLRAARDAQQRVARFLAEQIHLQLATKLAAVQ